MRIAETQREIGKCCLSSDLLFHILSSSILHSESVHSLNSIPTLHKCVGIDTTTTKEKINFSSQSYSLRTHIIYTINIDSCATRYAVYYIVATILG